MERTVAVSYLQNIMGSNKAMGLVAQADFQKWVHECGGNVERKYFNGCWVMSPKGSTANKRMCFFVHEKIETKEALQSAVDSLILNRGFHGLCGSMVRSGFGVFHCFAIGNSNTGNLGDLEWTLYRYRNENLSQIDAQQLFAIWPGRGRAGRRAAWDARVIDRYQVLDLHVLESLVLNQVFFNSFVKELMKKPVADPYDVDGFFVSYEGKILPLEIKEKFPFEANRVKLLGIDAGRILMLMRICLPLDCNGLYIIREVEDSPQRRFVGWKMTTLDSIVMNSNWTLQAGGTGMTGGPTQTVTFPYECFSDLNAQTFSDESLHRISEFSKIIKEKAAAFQDGVERFIESASSQSQRSLPA
ncbi:MAG: hypothetical protein ABSB28_05475 [Candidatus Bathyarchaeia archaeon]